MNNIREYVEKNNIGKYVENVSLGSYTTYKTGGIARFIVYPKDLKKLIMLLKYLKQENIKNRVIGNGSNTLFSDNIYNGVLIKLDEFNKIEFHSTSIKAGAGVNLVKLSYQAIAKSLTGLEFATGIPGTVGGAVYMNAGAYKSDMGYVVKSVKVITPNFEVITLTNKELDFHYRTSFLKDNPNYICIEANIQLKKGDRKTMLEIVDDRRKRRVESQPIEMACAGSVFRNPPDLSAWQLIDGLGLKGLTKGGAMVSPKHANFIVNYNNATSKDIKELIDFLREQVKEHYNIELILEQELVNWE